MNFKLKKSISIKNLIENKKINLKFFGDKKRIIDNISSIKFSNSNSISFIESDKIDNHKKIKGVVILKKKNSFFKNQIIHKNPRLLFCKIINLFFSNELNKKNYPIKNFRDKFIKKNIKGTIISENVFIGESVSIGKNCYIGRNVVIYPGTKIGNNVVILDNTILGLYGLGYVKNNLQPHLGNLIIRDDVKLGSNCSIVRGTLENTIIGKSVKIGNNVNIGHNVIVKNNCLISSSTSIAGGSKIKSYCELALGTYIKNNITIGNHSKICIGAVVTKNIKSNSMIFGNPGKNIILLKKIL
jgi:UDP-3-O-[3-hydroxymyristoyl] glucosamine N-acyltransferase